MTEYINDCYPLDIYLEHAEIVDAVRGIDCSPEVALVCGLPYVAEQLALIPDIALVKHLEQYGAWEDEELKDRAQNVQRVVWIACGDICENNEV